MTEAAWTPYLQEMTVAQRLIFRVLQWGLVKQAALRLALFNIRRRAYLDELNIQARRVGCPDRRARLGWPNPILTSLNRDSVRQARAVREEHNVALAKAILAYGRKNPNANRAQYLNFLRRWEDERNKWKIPQALQLAEAQARSKAFSDFYTHNRIEGTAIMLPLTAVCPVCQGWLDRIAHYGPVPLSVASANPPPYHLNCPHRWVSQPIQLSPDQCRRLWMGR